MKKEINESILLLQGPETRLSRIQAVDADVVEEGERKREALMLNHNKRGGEYKLQSGS